MWRLCSQCDLVRFYGGIDDAKTICSSECLSIFYDYTKVHDLLCDEISKGCANKGFMFQ